MENTIISLNCPKCGSVLEGTSDTLILKCKYCDNKVVVKDFITPLKIDNKDRLTAYTELANNALSTHDYTNAECYYKLICEINSSKENLIKYNICKFLNNTMEYTDSLLNETDIFSKQDQIKFLNYIYKKLHENLDTEKSETLRFCTTESVKKSKASAVEKKYIPLFHTVEKKLSTVDNDFKPIHISHNTASNHGIVNFLKYCLLIIFIIAIIYFIFV